MSFPQHPFRHVNLVDLDDNGIYYWRCDGCGADGQRQQRPIPLNPSEPAHSPCILSIIKQYHDHVKNSHGLAPEDVKDWYV